jgi:hypothetical protein
MGAKKKALKALRRKFSPPRHPKISQSLKRAIDKQDSGVRIQDSGVGRRLVEIAFCPHLPHTTYPS